MKTKILICLLFPFLFSQGCAKEYDPDIISLDDPDYFSYNDLIEKKPELRDISFKTMDEIKSGMDKLSESKALLSTRIYLDESGKVDKLALLDGVNRDFDSYALGKIKQLIFVPAVKNNKPVKFYFDSFIKKSDDNFTVSPELDTDTTDSKFMVEVDQMPEPVGGIQAIAEKVKYPVSAKEEKIQGVVYVQANIDEKGNVVSTKIMKNVEPSLDEAAVDAVKQIKFTPGINNGKPVKVQIVIPIAFKLH